MRRQGAPQGVLWDAKPRKWPPMRHRFGENRSAGRSAGDEGIGVSLAFPTRRHGSRCLQRCPDSVSQAPKTAVRMPHRFREPPILPPSCRVDVRRMSSLERDTTGLQRGDPQPVVLPSNHDWIATCAPPCRLDAARVKEQSLRVPPQWSTAKRFSSWSGRCPRASEVVLNGVSARHMFFSAVLV